ncbi:DUF1835 domain-containing protein [Pontibacter sp. 13R65]|uniref:DUF1835 domain-containing protein n=1 Tax=Pontibacter sp. 13R65 TaxID=3127458 RepID=UPI00301BED2A
MKTLHVLNGDASVPAFEAAEVPGDILVWREIMSEGPVVPQVKDEAFWEMRQQYIVQYYAESEEAYQSKVLEVVPLLRQWHGYEELVLWFDTDLMCQINLLFLLHYIRPQHHQRITVATPAHTPVALLTEEEVQAVYAQRQVMTTEDLSLAQQLWQAYADESPLLLQELLYGDLAPFSFLKQALTLHFHRFPDCHTGLNQVETLLLQLLEKGTTKKQKLMQAIWQAAPDYGYGDKQLDLMLEDLSPSLLQLSGEIVTLTAVGIKVLQGQIRLSEILAREMLVGGVRLDFKSTCWCRDAVDGKVKAVNKNFDAGSAT